MIQKIRHGLAKVLHSEDMASTPLVGGIAPSQHIDVAFRIRNRIGRFVIRCDRYQSQTLGIGHDVAGAGDTNARDSLRAHDGRLEGQRALLLVRDDDALSADEVDSWN